MLCFTGFKLLHLSYLWIQQDVKVAKSVKPSTSCISIGQYQILVLEKKKAILDITEFNTLPTGYTDAGAVGVTRGRHLTVSKAGIPASRGKTSQRGPVRQKKQRWSPCDTSWSGSWSQREQKTLRLAFRLFYSEAQELFAQFDSQRRKAAKTS